MTLTPRGRLIHDEEWKTNSIPPALARVGAWVENEVLDEDAFIRPWMVDISSDHYELDLGAAREHLGWTPRHSLREDLPRIIETLKADPYAWYRDNKLNAARVADSRVETAAAKGGYGAMSGDGGMMREHRQSMRKMHFQMLWVHWLTMGLGLWLATTPFAFGTFQASEFPIAILRVSEDRGLWDPAYRSMLTGWNNSLSAC